jgi:hypothetical protein
MNVTEVPRTIQPFTVTQRPENRQSLFLGNVVGSQSTFATQAWNTGNYAVSRNAGGSVSQRTYDVGTYAAIVFMPPQIVGHNLDPHQAHEVQMTLDRVSSFITFENMPFYNPEAPVSSAQLNRMVFAIAAGNESVNINAPLTSDEFNSLARSGLVATHSDAVTRQEAISILVRLYELKTRTMIRNFTPLLQTRHLEILRADERFQNDLLKASDLGFFENTANPVRPLESMTMQELVRIVDLIIQYAGLE